MSVIHHRGFNSIPATSLKPARKIHSAPSHKALLVKGQFIATLKSQDREAIQEMFAVRRLRQVLLECSAIESLGLVRRLNAVQTKTDLRKDFPQICVDLPRLNESVCREHHPTPSRLWHSWQEHVCSPSSTQTQGSGRFPRPKNPHS